MNLIQIESFIEVVKTGSMGQAAKKLFLSQPAVTQHIQKLEKELQCELFNRENKHLQLTHEGKAFLRYAEFMHYEYNNCVNTISRIREGMTGTLEIVTTSVAGEYVLPPILNEFKSRYKFIDANIHVVDQDEVINTVKCEKGVIGFTGIERGTKRNPQPEVISKLTDLKAVRIGRDDNVFIAYTGHPLTAMKNIVITDLIGETLVLKEIPRSSELEQIGLDLNSYRPRIITDTIGGVLSMVQAKLGIGYVPYTTVKGSDLIGKVKVLDVKGFSAVKELYCIYKREYDYTALTANFVRFINELAVTKPINAMLNHDI